MLKIKEIRCGFSHVAIIMSDDTLWTCGSNLYGTMGNGTITDIYDAPSPLTRVGHHTWRTVVCGHNITTAIRSDGTLWEWGAVSSGERTSLVPSQVGEDTDWVSLETDRYHTVGFKSDGTVWVWGDNSYGQLGNPHDSHVPYMLNDGDSWSQVSCGASHTVGIKSDGSMWSWGDNKYWQLGTNVCLSSHVPTKIDSSNDWYSVSCGSFTNLAIKTDGTLWMWGRTFSDNVNEDIRDYNMSPKQITNDNDWVMSSSGDFHHAAIKEDGSLWLWGGNSHGQLGSHKRGYQHIPTKLVTDDDITWKSVSCSRYGTVAVDTNGDVWVWGLIIDGLLSQGDNIDNSVPTKLSYNNNNEIILSHGNEQVNDDHSIDWDVAINASDFNLRMLLFVNSIRKS